MGENGCGKSTLIKILAGVHAPDSGTIQLGTTVYSTLHPAGSLSHGIQVVYQDFSLFPNLTVAENIAMVTHLQRRHWLVHWKQSTAWAQEAVAKLGINLELEREVRTLSVGQQQMVAIARALHHTTRLLVMDEPTAALTHREINRLFDLVCHLKAGGVGCLLVTHKIPEVLAMADRITVLRNGRLAVAGPARHFTPVTLLEAMTGCAPTRPQTMQRSLESAAIPQLQVQCLSRRRSFSNVSFELNSGEILALTGRLGAGRGDLARALFGLLPVDGGTVHLGGKQLPSQSPGAAVAAGLAYVPEDRLQEGLFTSQSVLRNLFAGLLPAFGNRAGWVAPGRVSRAVSPWIDRLRIRLSEQSEPVEHLSGGNQQKVVLARWLACGAKVLMLNRPTMGVDVAAKTEIHRLLRDLAARGLSILLISDDLPEVLELSDRMLAFHEGHIVAEWNAAGLDLSELTARLDQV